MAAFACLAGKELRRCRSATPDPSRCAGLRHVRVGVCFARRHARLRMGIVDGPAAAAATGEIDEEVRAHWQYANRSRVVWIMPRSKAAFTAAIEAGFEDFVYDFSTDGARASAAEQYASYSALARHRAFCVVSSSVGIRGDSLDTDWLEVYRLEITNAEHTPAPVGRAVAEYVRLKSEMQQEQAICALKQEAGRMRMLIMDATTSEKGSTWSRIPAENLIAVAGSTTARGGSTLPAVQLLAKVDAVDDAWPMLESLDRGMDGVILEASDALQVIQLRSQLELASEAGGSGPDGLAGMQPQVARVVSVTPVGMGDRVCVDMCQILRPDEGILVGNSSQGMFLVLSEASENAYVASRPFRVNASAVCAYTRAPQGRTAYLSELHAGRRVLVVSAHAGSARTAVVGRVKIEQRPLLLVEAEASCEDGEIRRFSIMLQNAETVKLAVPSADTKTGADSANTGVSVTQLRVGDAIVVALDTKFARHTGIAIDQKVLEK
ncbi:3-dehydroquinate synthase [Porphyridium purpureum]|uniref:3-dehydroquinate synthase n=1 Tax=Porphyridium purpureum TaxID=35688 RepID=A0A5J4Z2J6_PORPP|nr:3-dehydroquinate synthase [Porphyridium purpureum]|eukprot:POR6005..scf295_1